jgi:uncharacterized phage-associated protein
MSHPFYFDVPKTIQAIGVLLRNSPGRRMNYLRLLKLLYIADRESLRETGRPITGDQAVAMPRGPVLSGVYNLVRGHHMQIPLWNTYFRCEKWDLEFRAETEIGDLSKYEIEKLESITRQYDDRDEWEMVEETHKFPEWKKNDPGDSSRPIPLEDILDAVGRAHDIEAIINDEKDRATFDRIFNVPLTPRKEQPS